MAIRKITPAGRPAATNTTMRARKPREPSRRKSVPSKSPGDLREILAALSTARALVAVSLIAVDEKDDNGPESYVLRLGVKALDDVYDSLDRAIITRLKGSAT